MSKKPKISILLAAYKSEELLREVFFPSFHENSSTEVELVVYDNGGNGGHPAAMTNKSHRELQWIGDGKNVGLNAALNACAEVATGDWFYLPHTDMYLMPGWDTALLNAVKNQPPGKQLLCSRSVEPTKGHTEYHIIKNYGTEPNELKEEQLLNDFRDYHSTDILSGYRMPFFLHKSLWKKMGGVDSHYFSYCTDDDLVQEAYHAGVRQFWMVYGSLVYHLQGKSNEKQAVDKDSDAPYQYFVEKWKKKGYNKASHPANWHPKLIPWYIKVK